MRGVSHMTTEVRSRIYQTKVSTTPSYQLRRLRSRWRPAVALEATVGLTQMCAERSLEVGSVVATDHQRSAMSPSIFASAISPS